MVVKNTQHPNAVSIHLWCAHAAVCGDRGQSIRIGSLRAMLSLVFVLMETECRFRSSRLTALINDVHRQLLMAHGGDSDGVDAPSHLSLASRQRMDGAV
jgi:uncharacterized membrane protein